MNKLINKRAGHAPVFPIEMFYLLIAMVLGWPVSLPTVFILGFLSDHLKFDIAGTIPSLIIYSSCIVGMYVHYRLWKALYLFIKAWWNS